MSSNHQVNYAELTPAMREYFSKASMWQRMNNKNAKTEQQALTDGGFVWLSAESDDGSVERWGYRYTQDENGNVKFDQNDLAAYQHSSDGNITNAAHDGTAVYYYEHIDEASSIVSSDIYKYDESSRPAPEQEVNPFQAQYEATKAAEDRLTHEGAIEKSHAKSDYDRTSEELQQLDAQIAESEASIERDEALASLEDLDEDFSETELSNEKSRIKSVRDRREEEAEFDRGYREALELSEKLEREKAEKDAENESLLSELEDLPSDEPDEDFVAEKERISKYAEERRAAEKEAEDTQSESAQETESETAAETDGDSSEETVADLTGEVGAAASETAAAEAADTTADASAAVAYAAAVANEPVINHIFKNSFYNDMPAVKWSFSIDFQPSIELAQYSDECFDWAKILTKTVISTEIPTRESTSVTSNFKGVTCELPARTKTSGDLRIQFAENEMGSLMYILHELQSISYNRYYPYNEIPGIEAAVEQISEDVSAEEKLTIFRQPSRFALIDHGHQFNIAIYLYRPINAHAFNPFAEGQTPDYVYFFHKCDLYQIGNINFDYTKDSAIDMVGTFMYQHFEEMTFDEYCEKRFVTADEWADKELEKAKKAELDEMAAKAAARQSAMASQAAGAGASRAGASSYGRSR